MLPSLRTLIQHHIDFCAQRRIPRRSCDDALATALGRATELADSREENEPAALLYALTLEPRALGDSWSDFPIREAVRLARAAGSKIEIETTDVDLENLRLRAVVRGAAFEDLRIFIASKTHPLHLRLIR